MKKLIIINTYVLQGQPTYSKPVTSSLTNNRWSWQHLFVHYETLQRFFKRNSFTLQLFNEYIQKTSSNSAEEDKSPKFTSLNSFVTNHPELLIRNIRVFAKFLGLLEVEFGFYQVCMQFILRPIVTHEHQTRAMQVLIPTSSNIFFRI